jgi:hypothetical protein
MRSYRTGSPLQRQKDLSRQLACRIGAPRRARRCARPPASALAEMIAASVSWLFWVSRRISLSGVRLNGSTPRTPMKSRSPLKPILLIGALFAVTPVRAQQSEAVPPPVVEVRVAMPEPPPLATKIAPLQPAEIAKLTPTVEGWRAGSNTPQRPIRRQDRTESVLVTDEQPVVIRLQFDRSASGKKVYMVRANSVTMQSSEVVVRIRPTGECVVAVLLDPGAARGHATFICEGVETTIPFVRSTPQQAAAKENAAGGPR